MKLPSLCFAACLSIAGVAHAAAPKAPQHISANGGSAYYYPPSAKGSLPVFVYLHGRGGHADADCMAWAKVVRSRGWLVCPEGQESYGSGRSWGNNAAGAAHVIRAVLEAMNAKHKGRVRTHNNVLMGFSEGAFVAQQLGIQEPQTWTRWLILAATDAYWMGDTVGELKKARPRVRGVYLVTGALDETAPGTKNVAGLLKKARIPVRASLVKGMGHELAREAMNKRYGAAVAWLASR